MPVNIRSVSAAKPKVADYPFTTLVPNLGVVRLEAMRSFVIADIPGLIAGASDGAGLGIQFLKHLERCRVLLHLIDLLPADGSDPVENAIAIIAELEKYNAKLAAKPRWLVFNKVDLLLEDEVEELCEKILSALDWQDRHFKIAGIQKQGTAELCRQVGEFLDTLPAEQQDRLESEEEITFKWDNYHKDVIARHQQLESKLDDEDDEDDDEDYDVEVIYRE